VRIITWLVVTRIFTVSASVHTVHTLHYLDRVLRICLTATCHAASSVRKLRVMLASRVLSTTHASDVGSAVSLSPLCTCIFIHKPDQYKLSKLSSSRALSFSSWYQRPSAILMLPQPWSSTPCSLPTPPTTLLLLLLPVQRQMLPVRCPAPPSTSFRR
jgi:hypothetical protein